MILHMIQGIMVAFVAVFSVVMGKDCWKNRASFSNKNSVLLSAVSFITMFLDTLGIGSVPPRTAFYKIGKIMPDNLIPGTLMIHDVIPCTLAAFIFMLTIDVELMTLIPMVLAAAIGSTIGARFITRLPIQRIQMILGVSLILVACIISAQQLNLMPPGGDAIGLHGWKLAVAVGCSCVSGFLLNIGIPYYPTTMAVTYLLGMSPRAVFPIMVAGCVLLMGSAGFYYVKEVTVDIKLIAATNQKPEKLVEEGTFRKDLYYRLNTIKIEIPPLKERREDIIPLIYFFLTKFNKKYKVKTVFTERALTIMEQYDWPGNVRELEHMIERMILINDNEILDLPDLPQELRREKEKETTLPTENPLHIPSKEEEKREIIQNYIELKSTYKVAKKMNISQSKVARIIKQHREQSDSVFRS